MTDNPYSAPAAGSDEPTTKEPELPALSLSEIAKATFLAWERLRIVYIVVLGLFTVLLVGPHLNQFEIWILIIEGAIFANLCFFAGPIIETYIRWLGYRRMWPRWFLWIAGTLVTAALALLELGSMMLPNQN